MNILTIFAKSPSMRTGILSGIIGASAIVLVIVLVIAYVAPIDYAPIYLLNPEKALSDNDSIVLDSMKCVHVEVLKDLESKGGLLTPCEYTSHITEYYNTLISFLLGLFVVFSFGTIYSIKAASRKEIDEIKADINDHKTRTEGELKRSIVASLSELMRDSKSFEETCINALYGRIEDEVLRHEDKDAIDLRMQKIEENVDLLFKAYEELEEEKSSNQEIE